MRHPRQLASSRVSPPAPCTSARGFLGHDRNCKLRRRDMSDRGVFTAAIVTAVLILAGAFVLPQLFIFESAKAVIFVAIAVMVFYGEDHYSYMLGIVFPPLWFIVDTVVG